jgi:hypothetical protein
MTSTWDSGASTWDSGASVWDVAPVAYVLTASRPGAGSVVLTATVGVARLAHQIVGVGVVDGTTTVTPAPPSSTRQYAVTVNTG